MWSVNPPWSVNPHRGTMGISQKHTHSLLTRSKNIEFYRVVHETGLLTLLAIPYFKQKGLLTSYSPYSPFPPGSMGSNQNGE